MTSWGGCGRGGVSKTDPPAGGRARNFDNVVALLALLASSGAFAVGTPAGYVLNNTATVDFVENGTPITVTSNVDTLPVDEVLDLTLVANDVAPANTTSPATNIPLSYTLTNIGNGTEPFRLTFDAALAGDQFDPQNVRIYIDNGDNAFGIGTDTLYVFDGNNPLLAADASVVLFVVSDIPAALATADTGLLELTATAQTGSGAPGTVFAGAGDSGVDAIVGMTTATDDAPGAYLVAQVSSTLVKSQSYTGVPASGTQVTYTLVFTLGGVGTVNNLVIRDPIPALSTYVPESITLDGSPLTDATDADEGRFDGAQIEVRPNGGAVAAPATYTVTFDVTID